MKGILCNCFTLFNVIGDEMDKAELVTVLSYNITTIYKINSL